MGKILDGIQKFFICLNVSIVATIIIGSVGIWWDHYKQDRKKERGAKEKQKAAE